MFSATSHHSSCVGFRWRTCSSALPKHILNWESTFHPVSAVRNTFQKSNFKTKLSQFLFSPYRNWFSSWTLPPLRKGSEELNHLNVVQIFIHQSRSQQNRTRGCSEISDSGLKPSSNKKAVNLLCYGWRYNGATCGVTVSMSAFLACHQCYCASLSLAWGLNLPAVVCGIFWSSSPGVFSGYSGFLPSSID